MSDTDIKAATRLAFARAAVGMLADASIDPEGSGADGITVLVHDPPGHTGPPGPTAMHSTHRTRAAVRRELMHVLYNSLVADGATPENVDELARAELLKLLAAEFPNPSGTGQQS